MMEASPSPPFPHLGHRILAHDVDSPTYMASAGYASSALLPASLTLPLCPSLGPGCQRKGIAEYGHHVLSPDCLPHSFSEQDGSTGPFKASIHYHWGGKSLLSAPPYFYLNLKEDCFHN